MNASNMRFNDTPYTQANRSSVIFSLSFSFSSSISLTLSSHFVSYYCCCQFNRILIVCEIVAFECNVSRTLRYPFHFHFQWEKINKYSITELYEIYTECTLSDDNTAIITMAFTQTQRHTHSHTNTHPYTGI